jgi:hypothetical protein
MSKHPKTKAQMARDRESRLARRQARAAAPAALPAPAPKERSAAALESAHLREQRRLDAIAEVKRKRQAHARAMEEAGEELPEDFSLDGTFDEEGQLIARVARPRLPAPLPAFHKIPVTDEKIDDPTDAGLDCAMLPEQREVFLREYATWGNVGAAAWHAGTTIPSISKLRRVDPLFDAAIREAGEFFKSSLEKEAVRRARDGYEKPIFSAAMGTQIGYERVYDSALLQMLLKKRIPDTYGDNMKVEHNVTGVLVIDNKTFTPEEWVEDYAKERAAEAEARAETLRVESGEPPDA